MGLDIAANGSGARVLQVYHAYLRCVYFTDHYKLVYDTVVNRSRHFDFLIALGATTAGGSGLGILGDPRFGWLCGFLTTASVVLVAAKNAYDWPGKLKFSADQMRFYSELAAKYRNLIDDIHVAKAYTDAFERAYVQLRDEQTKAQIDPFPQLKEDTRREVQNGVKRRIPYDSWWLPQDAAVGKKAEA